MKKKKKKQKREKEENSKRYIENLEVHIEKTLLNSKYALDRFDILIILISSGGLVFSMGFVKDLLPKEISFDLSFLKFSWVFFGISIILNLLSQVTSYYANRFEISISRNIIKLEKKAPQVGNQSNLECKKKVFNFFTNFFNWSSLVLLILAIILLIHFVIKTL